MEPFGARLKREREQRGVTLEEIAASTKIGTRMLRALEEEQFDQLPGGIFNKGFVRAYARQLGIDEEQAIADYLATTGSPLGNKPGAVEEAEILEVRPEEESQGAARIPWGLLAVALLLVAFGFAVWGFYSRGRKQNEVAPPPAGASPNIAPVAASPTRKKPGGDAKSAARDKGGQDALPTAGEPALSAVEGTPALPSEAAATTSPSLVFAPTPGAFHVLIQAHEDCWLTVTADGAEVMKNTLVAQADKTIEARKEIVIRAGNVGALDFVFNGKRLPAQGDYEEVKTLIFDANGLQAAGSKAQTPTAPAAPP